MYLYGKIMIKIKKKFKRVSFVTYKCDDLNSIFAQKLHFLINDQQ